MAFNFHQGQFQDDPGTGLSAIGQAAAWMRGLV